MDGGSATRGRAFFLTLGFISVDLKKLEKQNAFFTICLVAIAIRVVDVSVNWSIISQPLLELKNSFHAIRKPARDCWLLKWIICRTERSMQLYRTHPILPSSNDPALVSRLFVVQGKQILHVRPDYRDHVDIEDGDTPSISQVMMATRTNKPIAADDKPHYWDQWPEFYDYVIVLGTDPDESENPAPDLLQIMHVGRGFDLYRIKKRALKLPQQPISRKIFWLNIQYTTTQTNLGTAIQKYRYGYSRVLIYKNRRDLQNRRGNHLHSISYFCAAVRCMRTRRFYPGISASSLNA